MSSKFLMMAFFETFFVILSSSLPSKYSAISPNKETFPIVLREPSIEA